MTASIFTFQFAMSTIVVGVLSRWFVIPWLKRLDSADSYVVLLIPHLWRHVGSTNLLPAVIGGTMKSDVAWIIAVSDFACGLLAFVAIFALRKKWRSARALLLAFSVTTLIDCVGVGTLGIGNHASEHLGSQWYVVAYYVPVFLVSQTIILARLWKERSSPLFP